jgi:hypothetical protein
MVFLAPLTPVESPPEMMYLKPPIIIMMTDTAPTTIEKMFMMRWARKLKLSLPLSWQAEIVAVGLDPPFSVLSNPRHTLSAIEVLGESY